MSQGAGACGILAATCRGTLSTGPSMPRSASSWTSRACNASLSSRRQRLLRSHRCRSASGSHNDFWGVSDEPLVCRCSLFQQNRFVGTIPDSISVLPAVTKIDLENNTLTGAVPAAFWTNPSLTSLCAKSPAALAATQERNHTPLHIFPRASTDTRGYARRTHAHNYLSLL